MARTIEEIKKDITAEFMRNEYVAESFGFTPGDSFTAHFSKVSILGILFYVFAVAAWTLEKLFDSYRAEVDARIDEIIPHRPKWYRDKVLDFMKDHVLIPDTDRYDTTGMSEDAIAAAKVVKHAVASESEDASLLTIKVAGEEGGRRCKLDTETERQLAAYIAEIKDAGVRPALVNADPDRFNCEVDIYYDPMLVAQTVETACREAELYRKFTFQRRIYQYGARRYAPERRRGPDRRVQRRFNLARRRKHHDGHRCADGSRSRVFRDAGCETDHDGLR